MHTVKKAAEILGVSQALIYGLCAAGKIAHERYGLGRGTIRISEAALAEYQHRARVGAAASPTPAHLLPPLKHITLLPCEPAPSGKPATAKGADTS